MAERKTSKVVELHPDKIGEEVNPLAGQPTGRILFTFSDDTSEVFEITKVNESTVARLALHGAGQKIGDSYAGAAADDNPLEYAKQAVKDTIAQLYAGNWRVGGGGGGPRVNELAMAMARATGETLESCVEFVGAMTDEDKKVFRNKAKVKLALTQIAAEKAVARVAAAQKAVEDEAAAEAAKEAAPTA